MVFESSVWSTALEGFDTAYPSIVLTSHCSGALCELAPDSTEEEDLSHLGAAAPKALRKHRGWLADPDEMIHSEARVHPPIQHAGKAIPRNCPVCDIELLSRMALYHHIRSVHPNNKPYTCHDCGSYYNNLKELSSHQSNVHRSQTVSCSECSYTTTSKAKIRQYVRCHTQGILYSKSGQSFLTTTELLQHEQLHQPRDNLECDLCEAVYLTPASLCIHKIGKHSSGYHCENCGQCFDTLSQRQRQSNKCGQ